MKYLYILTIVLTLTSMPLGNPHYGYSVDYIEYEKQNINKTIITDHERELVEIVVMGEAQGELLEGKIAVAQVILNRSLLWNKSIEEVVYAKSQFYTGYSGEINQETKQAVAYVFDYGWLVFDDPVTHFYNPNKCNPYWSKEKIKAGTVGNHLFLY